MKLHLLGLMVICTLGLYGQTPEEFKEFNADNPKYFEDQFYLGITYDFLLDKPTDFKQTNLSYGLQGGIIKDIPLNSTGRIALGIGLGYAVNSYYSNMLASETTNGVVYEKSTEDDNVKRSKIENHLMELPLEIRWRDSTSEEYKFWRVYSGIKFGYVFGSRSKLVTTTDKTGFTNPDIRKFQYGLMFNFGYNTFNIHLYYSLRNLFEDGTTFEDEDLKLKPLRIGLIFYIL